MALPSDTGRQGEFLAAAVLERYGVECHHVDRKGADLWCKHPYSGRLFTVEVKTASKPVQYGGDRRKPRYEYHTARVEPFGVLCLVALDLGLIMPRVLAGDTVHRKIRVRPEDFTEDAQTKAIEEMLRRC